mmetsp:Transcript_23909/g.65654  ORF Transcript_23909/g.65654 Transcript_23909/m.65654 type:complete len:241 (-) Transcript_23909:1224-1946(-)
MLSSVLPAWTGWPVLVACSTAALRRAMSSAVLASNASSSCCWYLSQASSSSCKAMICSSRSFRRAVSAIMMSRCFSSSCLYRSTCKRSSSTVCLSPSNSFNLLSYSSRIRLCSLSSSCLKAGAFSQLAALPLPGTGALAGPPAAASASLPPGPRATPPTNIWLCIALIFISSAFFSSFSFRNSLLRFSRAVRAASLSASARRFCSSASSRERLSTNCLLRRCSSCLSLRSSRSYFRSNVF